MATFIKRSQRKNGTITYRQENSSVSVSFPRTAFEGGVAPDSIEIGAEGLVGPGVRRSGRTAEVDPAVAEARRVIAEARAQRKARLAEKLANMTPEQLAKREATLAKLKEKNRAKREAATAAA